MSVSDFGEGVPQLEASGEDKRGGGGGGVNERRSCSVRPVDGGEDGCGRHADR